MRLVNWMKNAICKNFTKAVTPPFLWGLLRKLFGRNLTPHQVSYQGVVTQHSMRSLHEGSFAGIYDRHFRLNPFNASNETRLRQYNACMFAYFAKTIPGDFLSAGISHGVAPRVIYDFVEFARLGKIYHFIDPFSGINYPGKGDNVYNTDVRFVLGQYPFDAPIEVHQKLIPDCFPLDGLERLAFAHLNTTHPEAEAASLEYLYEKLSPGGFILIDFYSFGQGQYDAYDPIVEKIGASVFSLVSGQGVIHKPCKYR